VDDSIENWDWNVGQYRLDHRCGRGKVAGQPHFEHRLGDRLHVVWSHEIPAFEVGVCTSQALPGQQAPRADAQDDAGMPARSFRQRDQVRAHFVAYSNLGHVILQHGQPLR